jgi:hypothetical protein
MDAGVARGGICKVLELIEDYPAALAYDFRTRFQLSIDDIGRGITWREAVLLISVLIRDPASWLQAAWSGWDYPVSREWIVSSHLWDLLASVNSGKGRKPKPYPNPFPSKDQSRSGKTDLPPDEVIKLLARMNPEEGT